MVQTATTRRRVALISQGATMIAKFLFAVFLAFGPVAMLDRGD
jgi:hypothetical protein